MLSYAPRIPLLVTVVALIACDSSATPLTAPVVPSAAYAVERDVDESLYDMSGSMVAIACDDGQESELVALEGQVFERFTYQVNPAGVAHASYHTMPIGLRGVGTTSGEEYRVKEQDQGSYTQTLMSATGSYRQSFKLFARTSHKSFTLVVKGHYAINANGEITVERERAVAVCDR